MYRKNKTFDFKKFDKSSKINGFYATFCQKYPTGTRLVKIALKNEYYENRSNQCANGKHFSDH